MRPEVVMLLLEKGANIEAIGVVRLLLEKGANIEATRSDDGSTPIYTAVYHGHTDVVRLLLEKSTDIEH